MKTRPPLVAVVVVFAAAMVPACSSSDTEPLAAGSGGAVQDGGGAGGDSSVGGTGGVAGQGAEAGSGGAGGAAGQAGRGGSAGTSGIAGVAGLDGGAGSPVGTAGAGGSAGAAGSGVLPPGNRPYFVVAMMRDAYDNQFGRLAEYTFGSDQVVTMTYWYWSAAHFTGNWSDNKKATGYTTQGCVNGENNCIIKTPVGFEPTASLPTPYSGFYSYEDGMLAIDWGGGQTETWRLGAGDGYTRIWLDSSSYGDITRGVGYGSTQPFSVAKGVSDIVSGARVNSEKWQRDWGCTVGTHDAPPADVFDFPNWVVCSDHAAEGKLSTTTWHNYLAGNPATDGRKNYWDQQLDSVTMHECDTGHFSCAQCMSPQGGHTVALLQIIKDDKTFFGWVGIEASLDTRATSCNGNAIIALEDITYAK